MRRETAPSMSTRTKSVRRTGQLIHPVRYGYKTASRYIEMPIHIILIPVKMPAAGKVMILISCRERIPQEDICHDEQE